MTSPSKSEPTIPMSNALALARHHGGRLVRYVGGYWSFENAPKTWRGNPVEYAGSNTIDALVRRGRLEYTEWKEGRKFRFPIAVKIKEPTDASL
jgi:hypothetical protein